MFLLVPWVSLKLNWTSTVATAANRDHKGDWGGEEQRLPLSCLASFAAAVVLAVDVLLVSSLLVSIGLDRVGKTQNCRKLQCSALEKRENPHLIGKSCGRMC